MLFTDKFQVNPRQPVWLALDSLFPLVRQENLAAGFYWPDALPVAYSTV